MRHLRSRLLASAVAIASGWFTGFAQTQWNPYPGNPVLRGGTLDPSVIYDSTSHTYSIWYSTPGGYVYTGTSTDGIAWSLWDSVALVSGPPGAYDQLIASVNVVRVGGSYFMYYTAYGPADTSTIGLAVSPDGKHWHKHPASPVLRPLGAGSWEFPKITGPRVVFVNGTFYMMYSGFDGAYQDAGLATSTDGIAWTRNASNPLIVHGTPGSVDGLYVGAAGVAYKDSTFYLVYRATGTNGSDSYCLAMSHDAVSWQRYGGNPIYPSPRSGWDAAAIGGGSLLVANSEFLYYYCGTSSTIWNTGFAYLGKSTASIDLNPDSLDFGWQRLGTGDTLVFTIGNPHFTDTLHVSSIRSNSQRFTCSDSSAVIPPNGIRTVRVAYTPIAAGRDTGSIIVSAGSPSPVSHPVHLSGHGYTLTDAPIITSAALVPNSYYQVRLIWLRSVHDTAGAADPAADYSVWRQSPGTTSGGPLWDFVETIPAAGFDRYTAVLSGSINYTTGNSTNIFMVAAHTRNLQVYMSAPDTLTLIPTSVNSVPGSSRDPSPASFSLEQNYPNPFNPTTIIRYSLPHAVPMTLAVFNMLGQRVATLAEGTAQAGVHEVRFDASGLASGMYVYRLQAGDFVQSRRLLLVK